MSTTVSYKNNIIATVINDTTTLNTVGKWLDANIQITDSSSGTAAISVVDTIDANGVTTRAINAVDISDTTALASDVASGKYFYTADGTKTLGTATSSGGSSGGTSATQHIIHFEFSDSTTTNINVYYDDNYISTIITNYTPNSYNNKTITLASLDNIVWYEPASIPMNTQLIDYTKCVSDSTIGTTGEVESLQWYYASDYTPVAYGMTFSYVAGIWTYMAFYDSTKTFIRSFYVYNDGTVDPNDSNTAYGTLDNTKIPVNAAYIRMAATGTNSSYMSLIRTA